MKKRFISALLAVAMALSLLPTGIFAADTVDEALGEIDIYNGGTKLSYLSVNGRVQNLNYVYYNYETEAGETKEIPAYCVNPTDPGVPQTVGIGESIAYIAEEKASDPKVMGIIANGYPTRGLYQLGLENKEQAYYATKIALWCYLLSSWDIGNAQVNPALTGQELARAQKILAAARDIYARGTAWDEVLAPEITCTPDRSAAYPVTIDGKQYKQQVFTFWSKTWVCNYAVDVSFTDPASIPQGTRIAGMDNRDITTLTVESTGDGYAAQFKVLYPAESVEGESGSAQLSFRTDVYKYAVYYAVCAEKDEYGNIQNYVVDTDPTTEMRLSAYSSYADQPETDTPETGLRIRKYETSTDTPLSGARFEVIGPDGDTIGTFATDGSGEILIPLSKAGNYTVTELEPPAYHLLSDRPTQNVTAAYGEVAELTFFNDPYGSLRVEKLSNTGEKLPGAVITIEHIESGQTYTEETTSAGVAVFDQIKPGAYRVQEETAPEGWLLDDTVYTANVASGGTATVSIVNAELPGLRIIKYDRKNMVVLPGVIFEVFRDTVSLGDFQTNELGEILLTDLAPGTYKVVEKATGNDEYILCTTPQEIELKAGDGIRELVFFNDVKPGIRLVKIDAADPSKVIPNAVFEIQSVEGAYGPKEFTTDENGEINLSNLPAGSYVVTEKACDGYIIDEAQRIIELVPNEDAQFVFTNSKLPSLRLIKQSADGAPLGGVSFRLAKIEDGSHYLDRTTDKTGEILWEGLDAGMYSLHETATVSDHLIDTTEHHIELFPGKTSTIVLQNDKRPSLTIHKRDADTGEPVPGTVFTVKAADGHTVTEVKTGEDGSVTIPNLLPITYEISEKSVPQPYLLDAPSQLITLHPNRDSEVFFENHKEPSLTIEKVDSITGNPIKGARFQIWYASNSTDTGELNDLGAYFTDENGRITLENVKPGWYKAQELEPAPGYQMKAPAEQECFIEAGKPKTLTFENTPLSAIVVWKYDSVTGKAVEGATFQVRYLSGTSGTGGTVIGTYRTSQNGSFTVTGCEAGTYVIEEVASDGSHVIDAPPQTVYISGEAQDIVQVYFGNSPKGALLVKKVDAVTGEPVSGTEFLVTESDGTLVGDANGKFVTGSSGTFLVDNIDPETTLVVRETRAKDGYLLDDTAQTATVKAGQTVTLEFRNKPLGSLVIYKLSGADRKTPLAGVQFKITYADGSYLPAEGGKLSSNGLYETDKNGQIILSGVTGTIIATEVQSIPGYTIDESTRSQTVVVDPGDTQRLYFYNDPVGGVEIVKVNEDKPSERIPDTTFEIRKLDDALVDTVTTGDNGRAFAPLQDGAYYAVETKAAEGFRLDDTPHYFEVKDGKTAVLRVTNKAFSGIIIHKTDSTTGEGIYGVTFVLYDSRHNPLGQYTTDDRGYAYIDEIPGGYSGRLYLRELEAAEGYMLDEQYKTVYVRPGATTTVEWENTPIMGQIQVYKYAAEYNAVTGTPAGTPLQGAVYEIIHARSGKVLDYITTDARGVAASKPLPLDRYKVVEVKAPAYWQVDATVHDVTLEYADQIIKLSSYDKAAALGVTITKRGNAEVLAGQTMRYDITVANTSNVPLENFYWHDKIPYDTARATLLTTGTYTARLNYRILYKTNYMTSYGVLASNLLTSNNYSFALNALPMQAGEVITDIYFDFGKVPVGFQSITGPTLSVIIHGNTVNGYQLVNRADAGGKYQGTWQTAQANWVTIVRKYIITPDLPKTGY